MKQFVIEHLEQACNGAGRIATCHRPPKDGDLLIDLHSGKHIAVYVINRAIRVPEIVDQIERNTKKHLASLYLLDGRMLPEDTAEIDPPHWMATLHALAHGRLYAYWCDGRDVAIRPVHLDWKWGVNFRSVHYGDVVQVNSLRTETNVYTSKLLTGRYAAADFGEGTFWKKPNNLQEQERNYSWRQWSYGSRRSNTEQQQSREEYAYDPWEDFERYYGDVGSGADYANYRTREERKPPRKAQSLLMRHYTVLGVNREATYDQVKQAYRLKARENHPDLHPLDKEKYTLKMVEINAAFDAISKQLKQSS
jgi:hypothetical protein